ncbi:MAG: hypothetical protein ACR2N7_13165, partial [Acidimicrobiia bacterium]
VGGGGMSVDVVDQLERYYAHVDSVDTPIDVSEVADRLTAVSPLPRSGTQPRSRNAGWVAFAAAAALILIVALPLLWQSLSDPATPGSDTPVSLTTSTQAADISPSEDAVPTVPLPEVNDAPVPQPSVDDSVDVIEQVVGIPTPIGFTGVGIAATIEPAVGPIVPPTVGPLDDPTGTVTWTNYGVPSEGPDPYMMTMEELPQGGYLAYAIMGGLVWYSADGRRWVDVSHVESMYSRFVEWNTGSLAGTTPDSWEARENGTEDDVLWRRGGDWWFELDTPPGSSFGRAAQAGGRSLIVATTDGGTDVEDKYLIVGSGDEYVYVDAPWTVQAALDADDNRQQVQAFGTSNGTFALLVSNYREDDILGSAPDTTELWISEDGIDWSHIGEIPFLARGTTGSWTAETRSGIAVVVRQTGVGSTSNSYWTSHDGVTWTEADVTEPDLVWIPSESAGTLTWHNFTPGSEITYGGGLIIAGDPFRYSPDGGSTWLDIGPAELDGPLVPFSSNGIAGELLFSTAKDGLWIGVAS